MSFACDTRTVRHALRTYEKTNKLAIEKLASERAGVWANERVQLFFSFSRIRILNHCYRMCMDFEYSAMRYKTTTATAATASVSARFYFSPVFNVWINFYDKFHVRTVPNFKLVKLGIKHLRIFATKYRLKYLAVHILNILVEFNTHWAYIDDMKSWTRDLVQLCHCNYQRVFVMNCCCTCCKQLL